MALNSQFIGCTFIIFISFPFRYSALSLTTLSYIGLMKF